MSLIEAAACGRPVIATRVGGIPEIVEHGVNGLLVEPNRVDDFAAAIEEMQIHFKRFTMESVARVSQIRERYSPENWVELAVKEYNTALELHFK